MHVRTRHTTARYALTGHAHLGTLLTEAHHAAPAPPPHQLHRRRAQVQLAHAVTRACGASRGHRLRAAGHFAPSRRGPVRGGLGTVASALRPLARAGAACDRSGGARTQRHARGRKRRGQRRSGRRGVLLCCNLRGKGGGAASAKNKLHALRPARVGARRAPARSGAIDTRWATRRAAAVARPRLGAVAQVRQRLPLPGGGDRVRPAQRHRHQNLRQRHRRQRQRRRLRELPCHASCGAARQHSSRPGTRRDGRRGPNALPEAHQPPSGVRSSL